VCRAIGLTSGAVCGVVIIVSLSGNGILLLYKIFCATGIQRIL